MVKKVRLESRSDSAREVRLGIKKRFRPLGASWNQEGAFYGQEAVFIEVRARIASTDMKTAVT
jgi:hypothetical protein